jgi:MoxR-like ATPase
VAKSKSASTTADTPAASKEVIQSTSTLAELWVMMRRAIRSDCRPIVYGPPGVGKSMGIAALCRKESWGDFAVVIGSQCAPEDINGFPIEGPPAVDGAGRSVPQTVFAVRDTFRRLNETGGILFLDEFTCTPPSVQAPMLRLLAEGVAGDFKLDMSRVGIVAAANPVDIAANGSDLPPPMANRLVHLSYPSGVQAVKEWCREFPGYWESPPRVAFAGEALSESHYMRARSFIAGFLSTRTGLWVQLPEDAASQAGPWPSPRTWDASARLIARTVQDGARAADAIDLVAGAIGAGAGLEFLTYMENQDLPDPEAILADPKIYHPTPDRPDVDHAVLSSVAEAVRADFTSARFKTACYVTGERCARSGQSPESAVGAYMTLTKIWEERGKTGAQGGMDADAYQTYSKYASAFDPLTKLVRKYAAKKK